MTIKRKIQVVTAFTLQHPDREGRVKYHKFVPGIYVVDEDLADNWYTQLHVAKSAKDVEARAAAVAARRDAHQDVIVHEPTDGSELAELEALERAPQEEALDEDANGDAAALAALDEPYEEAAPRGKKRR